MSESQDELSESRATLFFVPAVPVGELRLLSEARCLVIDGRSSSDSPLWQGRDGELLVTIPVGDGDSAKNWIARHVVGSLALWRALQKGEIAVLVESRETGSFYRVPRLYWFETDPSASDGLRQLRDEVPGHLLSQPMMVDTAALADWRAVAEQGFVACEVDKIGTPSGPWPLQAVAPADALLGTMPPSAKLNDHKHAEFAHEAASIVRQEKVSPEVAFRRVAPTDPMRAPASVVRAIRSAFGLMYLPDGTPIKN